MDKKEHIKRAIEQFKDEPVPETCTHIALVISGHDPRLFGSYVFVLRGFNQKMYREICTVEEFISHREKEFSYLDPDGEPCAIVTQLGDKAWVEYQNEALDDHVWFLSDLNRVTVTYWQFGKKVFELYQKTKTPEELGLAIADFINKHKIM